MKLLRKETPTTNESCLEFIEPVLTETLLGFQKIAVQFGIARGGRFLLADDCGLGKTRQALAVADFYKSDWPLLIVTTAAMRYTWQEEIVDLLPNVLVQDVCIVETGRDSIYDAKIVICSYAALKNTAKFEEKNFKMVIFDESHSLKDPKANQTKNATKLGHKANRVVLLTGTPALSRPKELFPQLAIIDKRFADFVSYANRYCQRRETTFGWDNDGAACLDELGVVLRKSFMIRRTKQEVYSQLGDKKREVVWLGDQTVKLNSDVDSVHKQNYYRAEGKPAQHQILLEWFVTTAKLKQEKVW